MFSLLQYTCTPTQVYVPAYRCRFVTTPICYSNTALCYSNVTRYNTYEWLIRCLCYLDTWMCAINLTDPVCSVEHKVQYNMFVNCLCCCCTGSGHMIQNALTMPTSYQYTYHYEFNICINWFTLVIVYQVNIWK